MGDLSLKKKKKIREKIVSFPYIAALVITGMIRRTARDQELVFEHLHDRRWFRCILCFTK